MTAAETPVFSEYARYYDLLYRDKDYPGEADYVDNLIRRFKPGAKGILEMGSGTGKHAMLLAKRGYRVHGIERSEEMLLANALLTAEQLDQPEETFPLDLVFCPHCTLVQISDG